jgi:hypothetical protein
MTMDLLSRKQFEEAASGDADAGVRAHVQASRVDTHTSMPGIVESFNADKQTAVVRPVVQRFFRGQGFKPLPQLFDVPVIFPRGGGFVLTFPVKQGDECILHFSERAIDNWHSTGKVSEPSEFRTHDLSDACAQVGVSSLPNVVQNFNSSAVELRSLDGKSVVSIDGGGSIKVTADKDIEVASTNGSVKLNLAGPAVPMVTGVLTGALFCPMLGVPHGSLSLPNPAVGNPGGGCSATVHVGG